MWTERIQALLTEARPVSLDRLRQAIQQRPGDRSARDDFARELKRQGLDPMKMVWPLFNVLRDVKATTGPRSDAKKIADAIWKRPVLRDWLIKTSPDVHGVLAGLEKELEGWTNRVGLYGAQAERTHELIREALWSRIKKEQ